MSQPSVHTAGNFGGCSSAARRRRERWSCPETRALSVDADAQQRLRYRNAVVSPASQRPVSRRRVSAQRPSPRLRAAGALRLWLQRPQGPGCGCPPAAGQQRRPGSVAAQALLRPRCGRRQDRAVLPRQSLILTFVASQGNALRKKKKEKWKVCHAITQLSPRRAPGEMAVHRQLLP